jgi:hypothetical protein
MNGHIRDQWTIPVGIDAELDAGEGAIRLLTPAVNGAVGFPTGIFRPDGRPLPPDGPLYPSQARYLVVEVIGVAVMWYISLMPNGLRVIGMTGITSATR